ncbi:phosphotransferase [Microbacterium sp.]|uniref:phosphotransferase n=1 Tax=Microbacterium sp. TaxID=51671 RepID=UPI0039E4C2E2
MLAGGAALAPVWLNGIGGLTFRTDDGRFIKWGPHDAEANMRDEAERLRWARRFIRVPEVIDQGQDDEREWLITVAIDATSAVDPRWAGDADAAARGERVPDDLRDTPPVDRLVVCHGDACMPNTLLTASGAVAGHVGLAALGAADRWADIAVAAMSTVWNVGEGRHDALIDAYGVDPDRERLAYYRRLWTLE